MTTDTFLAFAHPEERARAMAGPEPYDRISLRDHVVMVEIGAFQAERGTEQRLSFDVVVEVRPHPAPLHDDVDRILSYDKITEAIAAELEAERLNLLETLAERVAERILAEPQAMQVFLRIQKLDRGPGALGVEIVRSRTQESVKSDNAKGAVHPLVVYLDNAAMLSPNLGARLDALAEEGLPVVLTVGLPDADVPQAETQAAQRHIDLLAIEQNAWLLASRDKRCAVVDSRTEIDWAMKNGQMIVWAPSKLVLDAVDRPEGDGIALAQWLAEMLAAERLLVNGDVRAPVKERVPVEHRSR